MAEGGAMGEPNAFHVVLDDMNHYYINLGAADFEDEDFIKAFPIVEKLSCFCEHVTVIDDGWEWFNAGFGNYLIVRKIL